MFKALYRLRLFVLIAISFLINIDNIFAQEDASIQDEMKVERDSANFGDIILQKDTSNVYGPHTSFWVQPIDWFEIRDGEHKMDTSLYNFQRYDYNSRADYMYQELGNLSSAMTPIFYSSPYSPGVRLGLDSDKGIVAPIDEMKYYNSLTPVTSWYYTQAYQGETIVDVTFSRNINPYWSVGTRFRRLHALEMLGNQKINKQFKSQIQTQIQFNTRYESRNMKYKLMMAYDYMAQNGIETGGIATDSILTLFRQTRPSASLDDIYRTNSSNLFNNLTDAFINKKNQEFYLYHQYSLIDTSALQIFHEFRSTEYRNRFENSSGSLDANSAYYNQFSADGNIDFVRSEPGYKIVYRRFSNKLGAKGRVGDLFAAAYLNYARNEESIFYQDTRSIPTYPPDELFFVGLASYKIPFIDMTLRGQIKQELLDNLGNEYAVGASQKYFDVEYKLGSYLPSLMHQYFVSEYTGWNNDFKNSDITELRIAPRLPLGTGKFGEELFVEAFAELKTFDNHIYYDSLAAPQQLNEQISYNSFGVNLKYETGSFIHGLNFRYTQNQTDFELVNQLTGETFEQQAIPTPDYFVNYTIALQGVVGKVLANPLTGMIGFDLHWNSEYLGYGYYPVTQQFYLQSGAVDSSGEFISGYEIGGVPVLDFFINFRMRRTRLFLKAHNLLNETLQDGYFLTPNYIGHQPSFLFGLDWMLFD
ncbi:putative porin [Sediminitomix flava]|uniref:Putative beta-barrel porin n=1 Tax=Sediminitomix flava TaxID=379075 RepID=A0A315ZAS9_SEDFL|nr:putative porin [Sediminitomix flava]PWJ42402.1 putative beta-barrel porin [Sediminitomix flava]